jgi:hypothetical protein
MHPSGAVIDLRDHHGDGFIDVISTSSEQPSAQLVSLLEQPHQPFGHAISPEIAEIYHSDHPALGRRSS